MNGCMKGVRTKRKVWVTEARLGLRYDVKIIHSEGEDMMGLLGKEVDVDNATARIKTKVLRAGNHNKDSLINSSRAAHPGPSNAASDW